MIQEQAFHTGTVTLNYVEWPSAGPSLVLLHGGSARWQSFQSIMPELAKYWHLYAPDLRGHGQSGWTPGCYRLQDYATDLIVFIEQSVGEPVNLFGHSLGGIVALLIAGQRPDLIRALAIGDSPLSAEAWQTHLEEGRDKLVAWRKLAGGQYAMDALIEELKNAPVEIPGQTELAPMRVAYGEESPVFQWLATNLHQNDPEIFTALLDSFAETADGYDLAKLLSAIECPVLLLQADPAEAGLMTAAEIAQARRWLPHIHHVQLTGVSHALHHTHPELVQKVLIDFFAQAQATK
ncbi:MAG: alpha/beta hydrolase [Caldilineaceae bacterium]